MYSIKLSRPTTVEHAHLSLKIQLQKQKGRVLLLPQKQLDLVIFALNSLNPLTESKHIPSELN